MLIAIVLSDPIGQSEYSARALRPDPDRTRVASDRNARIDLNWPFAMTGSKTSTPNGMLQMASVAEILRVIRDPFDVSGAALKCIA